MYNHTCDIMDKMEEPERWLRQCPEGVQSCWYSEATYDQQDARFRGCAEAKYQHEAKCARELQAVQVVAGKKSVDVEVLLCYCNDDQCNTELSGAQDLRAFSLITILATASLLRNLMQ